ncbi:hypothetical protein ACD661_03510 [Legionella lytica]|uniref:NHL repeat protein n=1 Tax=Legionella lytica TaxID=96232 RepID=A0ABW8D4K2_9GAMM
MNKNRLKYIILAGLVLLNPVYGGIPVWTFTQVSGYPPSVRVSSSQTTTIKYLLTNQSHKIHTLWMKPIQGITSSGCISPLNYQEKCILTLDVKGSDLKGDIMGGPEVCERGNPNQCYRPSQADSLVIRLTQRPPGTATLIPSTSILGLSINCQPASSCMTTQDAALTGNPRQITIKNTGSAPATNISVSAIKLPSGTSISSTTCTGSLNEGDSCMITLTPGSIASNDSNNAACTAGTQPIAGTVMIKADGGVSSQVNIYVLGYGCQYQGGFIYSINDTTLKTGSIGGKVTALVDQAMPAVLSGPLNPGIIWSSNGNGVGNLNVDYTSILGIDETSTTTAPSPTVPSYPAGTPPYSACNGSTDGSCNSRNIVSYYNHIRSSGGSAPTPLNYYAAGLCVLYAIDSNGNTPCTNGSCYNDWYFPAICEMDAKDLFISCPNGTQSMVGSLSFLIGNSNAPSPSTSCSPPSGTTCLAGLYWSSTEDSNAPQTDARSVDIDTSGGVQGGSDKFVSIGVRCSRALSY